MMNYSQKHRKRRSELLDGISRNINLTELAVRIGVRRGTLIRDVKTMRRRGDTGLLEAQRLAQTRLDEDKRSVSDEHETRFIQMTGMSIGEKTFQNMVCFYKSELLTILHSVDSEAAIRDLPRSVRRTLTHNKILVNRVRPEVSLRARDELL